MHGALGIDVPELGTAVFTQHTELEGEQGMVLIKREIICTLSIVSKIGIIYILLLRVY